MLEHQYRIKNYVVSSIIWRIQANQSYSSYFLNNCNLLVNQRQIAFMITSPQSVPATINLSSDNPPLQTNHFNNPLAMLFTPMFISSQLKIAPLIYFRSSSSSPSQVTDFRFFWLSAPAFSFSNLSESFKTGQLSFQCFHTHWEACRGVDVNKLEYQQFDI